MTNRASKFYDNYWLAKVAYMASIFEHLNKLNLNLQSRKTDIFESMSKGNAVKKKLPLWQKRVASNNFSDFPLLHDFMKEHGSTFQQQLIPLIDEDLVRRVSSVVTSATHVQNDLVRFSVTSIE